MRDIAITSCMLVLAIVASISVHAADEPVSATVSYVTASTVYIKAGTEDGLRQGDQLTLYRGEEIVATLEIREISARRSACSILERTFDPQVGDSVKFIPVTAPPLSETVDDSGEAGQNATPTQKARRNVRGGTIRGRVGVSYLWLNDREDDDSGYSRPALNLRVDGKNLSGTPYGFSIDSRSRRVYRNAADQVDEDTTKVYRLSASRVGINDPWGFTVGRQYSSDLAAVSIFDGISARYSKERWVAGLFSGTQPNTDDFGYSSEIREHGLYLRYGRRPTPRKSWQLTTGLISSMQNSEPNRDFLYVQGRYSGPKLMVFLTEELDINRGWKKDAEDSSVDLTSSYISIRYRFSRALSVRGGYDNRRNVRLYRNYITPETEFDDSFRRALWVGGSFQFRKHFRAGLSIRNSGRDGSGDADSYTFSFDARRLTGMNIDVGLRTTRYTNDQREGLLIALHAGVDIGQHTHLRCSGGNRTEDRLTTIPLDNSVTWFEVDLEVDLGKRVFLSLSAERTDGDLEQIDQFYTSLNYRF
jgi:hypothetical protein